MKITGFVAAAIGSVGLAAAANAASVDFSLTDGNNLTVNVTLTEVAGDIRFDLSCAPGGDIGDLYGVFWDMDDDSLLTGLDVPFAGTDVTAQAFDAGNVDHAGDNSNNMNPNKFDAGVQIGGSGSNPGDDFQSTTFILTHDTLALSLDEFLGQSFGVRAQSIGPIGGSRGPSAKMTTTVPRVPTVPTPAAAGMGLVMLGLGALRRSRRQAAA